MHFSRYWNKAHIDGISEAFSLKDVLAIEKFIMDYEMLYHIQKEIPCIVVKGGMAVPFYTTDKKARRLSVDIDLVTAATADEIRKAFEKIAGRLSFVKIEPYVPKNPVYRLPLSTFNVTYKSFYSEKPSTVKVDIYHDFEDEVYPRKVPRGYDLLALSTDYEFDIYGHGALIGDKLTTLAFNTVGIDPKGRKDSEIAKHIFDIGCLIRTADEGEMKYLYEMFKSASQYEIAVRELSGIGLEQIADDIMASMDLLLVFDKNGLVLSKPQNERFRIFRNQLFSTINYPGLSHKIDILVIKLLASYLKSIVSSEMTVEDFAKKIMSQIETLKELESHSSKKLAQRIREQALSQLGSHKNASWFKTLTTEELFLYGNANNSD